MGSMVARRLSSHELARENNKLHKTGLPPKEAKQADEPLERDATEAIC